MKIEFDMKSPNFWLKTIALTLFAFIFFFGGFSVGFNASYHYGKQEGYEQALNDVSDALAEKGIKLEWKKLGDGIYDIKLFYANGDGASIQFTTELHMLVSQYRPYVMLGYLEKIFANTKLGDAGYWLNWKDENGDGKHDAPEEDVFLISSTWHPMTLTTAGINWIADKIANSAGVNVTAYATYIGCSNNESSVSTSWQYIPDEITDGGLARKQGTVTDTGTGTWHCNATFTVTATKSVKLYGYYYDSYANAPQSTLVAAEQQGAENQKNLNDGDVLTVSVQGAISQG